MKETVVAIYLHVCLITSHPTAASDYHCTLYPAGTSSQCNDILAGIRFESKNDRHETIVWDTYAPNRDVVMYCAVK